METKVSYKTSEFWLMIAAQIFLLLNTTSAWDYMPEKWSGIAQAIVAGLYMLSRGWAKSGVKPNSPMPPPMASGNLTSTPTK